MAKERMPEVDRESDAVINLCGASEPREEHRARPMMVYLETDPGVFQVAMRNGDDQRAADARRARVLFTYAANIGQPDCRAADGGPAHGIRRGRRCCSTNGIRESGRADAGRRLRPSEPGATRATTSSSAGDLLLVEAPQLRQNAGRRAARRSADRARDRSRIPAPTTIARWRAASPSVRSCRCLWISTTTADISSPRAESSRSRRICTSRTRSGWFSDRTVCYLAGGPAGGYSVHRI